MSAFLRAGPMPSISSTLSEAACAAGGKVKVHLKADTGMGRIGFALRTDFDAALTGMLDACRLPGLDVTGLFQHFAVADDDSADSGRYSRPACCARAACRWKRWSACWAR